jgi:DNA-binding LytR/AlgR family response regulator
MSGKLKLALLEDSTVLLKDLKNYIEDNRLGEVAIIASDSEDFLKQFDLAKQKPDALILDIDLAGDTMTGVDVANHLNLPVFFISGKTKDYLEQIQALKLDKEVPVEFMTKPISSEKLVKLFDRFEKTIKAFKKTDTILLPITGFDKECEIQVDDIVFIRAVSAYESKSNNKEVQLRTSEKPLNISHKSMNYFFDKGLSKAQFIEMNQSYIVNKAYVNQLEIKRTDKSYRIDYEINGKTKHENIDITERYWKNRKL